MGLGGGDSNGRQPAALMVYVRNGVDKTLCPPPEDRIELPHHPFPSPLDGADPLVLQPGHVLWHKESSSWQPASSGSFSHPVALATPWC